MLLYPYSVDMISYIRIYARGTFSYPYSYHIIFTPSVLPLRRNDSVHFHVHTEDILNQCNIEIIRAHILHAYPYQGRSYHYCIGYSADNESLRLSQLQNPSCSLCPSSSRPCRMLHVVCCSSTIVTPTTICHCRHGTAPGFSAILRTRSLWCIFGST